MSTPRPSGFGLGVDIGGTFTDLALLDRRNGRVVAHKVLTDYADLARGVLEGIKDVLAENGVSPASVRLVAHGTTLATNALIQRRGAKTALVVTRGFRDTLESARGTRYDIFDLDIDMPEPLVPRSAIFEIEERIDHKGRVVTPLAREQARALARELAASGFESVAVCLLHAHVNPSHEQALGTAFSEEAAGVAVSLSSDVIPMAGEYERATTTVANIYLQPVVRNYLDRLQGGLRDMGIARPPMVMTSDGGIISCSTAIRYPVRLVESGPAGGAIAASYFGEQLGLDRIIGFDMGGTTAKICIIDDYSPARATEVEVARIERFAKGSGLPLKVPAIEMIEIGAGGGSIARIDRTGLLKVGPESAGAAPGPACYGFGGESATVTDADLCLGYLDAEYFLGGTMPLDRDKAMRALERNVAEPLALEPTRAAWGIHEVVNNNMARAAKIHCLERGKDPRKYTMVAFGGAGPIHAYRIAKALGLARILCPSRAGIMSAIGFLAARPSFEFLRSYEAPLASGNLSRINELFAEMEREGRALLRSADVAAGSIEVRRELGIRYVGQTSVLYLGAPANSSPAKYLSSVERAFVREYQARYHRAISAAALEIVSLRALVSGPRPNVEPKGAVADGSTPSRALKGRREIYLPEMAAFVSCPVYDRYSLVGRVRGPAVVEERESTVVVGPGARIEVDSRNNLLITMPASPRRPARRLESQVAAAKS